MSHDYVGGCQCGKVRYKASLDLGEVFACDCSRCGKLGSLFAFAPVGNFELLSGEKDLTEFLFNKRTIHHLFCATCGIESFARGEKPGAGAMVAINARCLDGVDVDMLTIKKIKGSQH